MNHSYLRTAVWREYVENYATQPDDTRATNTVLVVWGMLVSAVNEVGSDEPDCADDSAVSEQMKLRLAIWRLASICCFAASGAAQDGANAAYMEICASNPVNHHWITALSSSASSVDLGAIGRQNPCKLACQLRLRHHIGAWVSMVSSQSRTSQPMRKPSEKLG